MKTTNFNLLSQTMKQAKFFAVLLILLTGCDSSGEKPVSLNGTWQAVWSTESDDFVSLGDHYVLSMNGFFVFKADSVSIIAQGFPGCIFGEDTLVNTQGWEYAADSLHLITPGGQRGLSYAISDKSKNAMTLTLMQDIQIKLVKLKQAN